VLVCMLEKVRVSPNFSLLCDGGTDICTADHLIKFRYLDMVTFQFATCFLCILKVNADDSNHHTNMLVSIMDAFRLDKSKLVGFCSNGASNYTGRKNGFAVRKPKKSLGYYILCGTCLTLCRCCIANFK